MYLGEAVGVATNSKGNIFVYTRTGNPSATLGTRRTFSRGAARLFEFDPSGKFIREIGQGLYGFLFAHTVRIDRQDNIWVVDEGSNMVIKFDPEGRVLMTMGRKPEAIPVPPPPPPAPAAPRLGHRRTCPRWHRRARRQLQPPDRRRLGRGRQHLRGRRLRQLAHREVRQQRQVPEVVGLTRLRRRGSSTSRTRIAIDAQGLVYVGDRTNNRIQVFDGEGTFKTQFVNVGAPSAICITPGPRQYLYASNSNPSTSMDNGEIYKMTLDGKIVGKFGTAGKLLKEFGSVHEMDCRSENELYVGEITNWRVQKLTLKPR